MSTHETLYRELQSAIRSRKTEEGEIGTVARILAKHGFRGQPQVLQAPARGTDGRNLGVARLYVFTDTPAGDFVLITGPKVEAVIERPTKLHIPGVAKGSVFAQAPNSTVARTRRVHDRFASHERTAGREPRRRASKGGKPAWISTPGVASPIGRPLPPMPALPQSGVFPPLVQVPAPMPSTRRPRRGGDADSGDWIPAGGLPPAATPEPSDAQRMALFEQLLTRVLGQVAA